MKQTFFIAIVNREYKGQSGFYIVSPICKDKADAEKFVEKEYLNIVDEFASKNWEWDEVEKDGGKFYMSDNHNYSIWGWVEEMEVETDFSGQRFAYTIFYTKNVDGNDDNDYLYAQIVFTDAQTERDKVYQAVDKIVEDFKAENPADEYGETDEDDLIEHWHKSVGFDTDDESGELELWFEMHDII